PGLVLRCGRPRLDGRGGADRLAGGLVRTPAPRAWLPAGPGDPHGPPRWDLRAAAVRRSHATGRDSSAARRDKVARDDPRAVGVVTGAADRSRRGAGSEERRPGRTLAATIGLVAATTISVSLIAGVLLSVYTTKEARIPI